MIAAIIADEISGQGWWAEYLSLLTDPAHLMLELTLQLVVDGLLVALVWPKAKAYAVRKHDERFHNSEHSRKPVRPGYELPRLGGQINGSVSFPSSNGVPLKKCCGDMGL